MNRLEWAAVDTAAQILASALLAASLTGLVSLGVLAAEWRHQGEIRRAERRLETAKQIVESLGALIAKTFQQHTPDGPDKPFGGYQTAELRVAADAILLRCAVLRNYGVSARLDETIAALERTLPTLATEPGMGLRMALTDAISAFRGVVLEELTRR